MLAKEKGKSTLLFDPVSRSGKENREKILEKYEKIALVKRLNNGREWLVDDLGTCNTDGQRKCKDKVGNDFLTTQLKKASESGDVKDYPTRPVPLLHLGVVVRGLSWGISKHPDWQSGLYCFLDERRSGNKWTDLAVFVLRTFPLPGDETLHENVYKLLNTVFSEDVASYWCGRIRLETRTYSRTTSANWQNESFVNELEKERHLQSREKNKDEIIKQLREENEQLREEIEQLVKT